MLVDTFEKICFLFIKKELINYYETNSLKLLIKPVHLYLYGHDYKDNSFLKYNHFDIFEIYLLMNLAF